MGSRSATSRGCPGATVNPGVKIGRNCVVGVNSLVTSNLPDGSLAVGSPAKVIKENAYPRPFSAEQRARFFDEFLARYAVLLGSDAGVRAGGGRPRCSTRVQSSMPASRPMTPDRSPRAWPVAAGSTTDALS